MAEGVVEGLLGAEEEPEREESTVEAAGGADPFAVTIAMDGARYDPELARKAGEYLDKQRELVVHTLKHFDEERHLAVQAAKRKRISDLMKIGLQLVLAFVGFVFVVGFIAMVVSAVRSRSVVVEEFKAPPSLTPAGFSGEVVATDVLDHLQRLQDATRAVGTQLTAKSAWASDVKIELPETGVSIGEVSRLLHEHLGHDLHISGDLVQTPEGGLELTVRGDGVSPKTFAGGSKDLDKLTEQAAEHIYGQSQPFEIMSFYLVNGRWDEGIAFAAATVPRTADAHLRAELLDSWAIMLENLGRIPDAIEKYRLSIATDPQYWTPRSNIINDLAITEGEEAAYQASKSFLAAYYAARPSERPSYRYLMPPAASTWDLPLFLVAGKDQFSLNNGNGAGALTAASIMAQIYTYMHDATESDLYLARSDPHAVETEYSKLYNPVYLAVYTGEPGSLRIPMNNVDQAWDLWQKHTELQPGSVEPCLYGFAYGLQGDMTKADSVMKHGDAFVQCAALRGVLLERQGKLAEAEAKWTAAIARAPDIPWVYLARGQSRMRRGELAGAIADFASANHSSPHFADPLKFWGDALVKQGDKEGALAKYDEALQYAPKWPELIQAKATVTR